MQVTGVISKRYDNENNVVLEVDGERYSAYKGKGVPVTAQDGASVSFLMKQNGNFKNIEGNVEVTGGGSAPATQAAPAASGGSADQRQVFIMKQNAMTNAVSLAGLLWAEPPEADVFALAERIYQSYIA